jgi:PHS family inorganic phosphate transporter-like MFS transporter
MYYPCPPDHVECFRAIDRLWRLVVGIGIIPAVIALAFRFTIPESPRYTLDILQNTKATLEDTANYFDAPELHPEHGPVEMRATTPQIHISRRTSTCSEIGPHEIIDDDSESEGRPSDAHLREPSPSPQLPPGDPSYVPPLASWKDAKNFFITEGNWQYLLGTSLAWLFLDFACKPPLPSARIYANQVTSLWSRSLLATDREQHLGEARWTPALGFPNTPRQ